MRLGPAIAFALLLISAIGHPAAAANARRLLPAVGVWFQVENRAATAGYWPGELIQNFDIASVADETALQLDKLKEMGVNRITYELRTADASTAPACTPSPYPSCQVCFTLGLFWPEPPAQQLTNLKAFFDLVATKGIKIDLLLTTTHMESSPTVSKKWLGPIFDTIKGHAALNTVLFGGDANKIDANGDGTVDACGGQGGEAPLYLGPNSYAGKYLKWVIPYAMSRGIAAKQLSAEAIIGDFFVDSEPPAGPSATDGHLWKPIRVMKLIFDSLGIPQTSRTYAASFYQRRKCSTAQHLSCQEMAPHQWAENRLSDALAVIGTSRRRQLIVTEGGTLDPKKWPAERAYESLGYLMQKYGTGGGNFWRWTSFLTSEDSDPDTARAVKKRGAGFTYFPPQKEILDLGGYHLVAIPNSSFEAANANGTPKSWQVLGTGSARRYHLSAEQGQPQVSSRGNYSLRLVTGASATAKITATTGTIPADPNRLYTITGNFRFRWTGDPNPSGPAATRPHVFVSLNYRKSDGTASTVKASETIRYLQEDGAVAFRTFPLRFRAPSDAAFVRIMIGAARNGLPTPITFDVDNLR